MVGALIFPAMARALSKLGMLPNRVPEKRSVRCVPVCAKPFLLRRGRFLAPMRRLRMTLARVMGTAVMARVLGCRAGELFAEPAIGEIPEGAMLLVAFWMDPQIVGSAHEGHPADHEDPSIE